MHRSLPKEPRRNEEFFNPLCVSGRGHRDGSSPSARIRHAQLGLALPPIFAVVVPPWRRTSWARSSASTAPTVSLSAEGGYDQPSSCWRRCWALCPGRRLIQPTPVAELSPSLDLGQGRPHLPLMLPLRQREEVLRCPQPGRASPTIRPGGRVLGSGRTTTPLACQGLAHPGGGGAGRCTRAAA